MSNNSGQGNFEQAGEAMGRIAGQMSDRAMEMTGNVFNSITSMMGSWWSGQDARQAASSFSDDQDRACRNHYQTKASAGGRADSYENSRPLYQMGHVASRNPSYSGKSFDEVEPDLRQAWESGPSRQYGAWPEVRDYVGYSYQAGSGSSGRTGSGGAGAGAGAGAGKAAGSADMNATGSTQGRTSIEGDANIGGAHVSGSIRMEGGASGSGREQAQGGTSGQGQGRGSTGTNRPL